MFKKLRSEKGEAILLALAVGSIIVLGFVQTALNGTLQQNGKLIWCKMLNNGNEICDARYGG